MTDLIHSEPTEVEALDAHQLEARIRSNVRQMRSLWIDLAGDLYQFHTDELWRKLGYSTFEAWLATPEIELERSYVFKLLQVYRELVVDQHVEAGRLSDLPIRKVIATLPAIRRGHVTVDEAIADIEATPSRDLEQRYRELTSRQPSEPEPPLDAETEPTRVQCQACGSWYEVRVS